MTDGVSVLRAEGIYSVGVSRPGAPDPVISSPHHEIATVGVAVGDPLATCGDPRNDGQGS